MAYRDFGEPALSRRALLRGGAWLGAGVALSGLPLGRAALAHEGHWPNVLATVEEYVASGKVANMIATLGWGQREPDIIARGVLGFGGVTRVDFDTLYRIYSMTKPITGVATMMLIEDGKLSLDQPLAEILPAFAEMRVQKEYDGSIGPENLEPAKRPITIRHLLTHTAGLGYTIQQNGPIKKAYEDNGINPGQITRLPIPGLNDAKPAPSLKVFADNLARLPLVYQPGVKWSYSVSMDLLGRVIEVAAGKPFDAFLEEALFEPCGMDSTWFQVPGSEVGRFTDNYGIRNGTALPIDLARASIYLDTPAFPYGGAGLVCSARDYDRFQRMLVGLGTIDGRRVMSETAVRVAASNILPVDADTAGTWVDGQGFGAGGRVTGTAYGWGGAAGTTAFCDIGSGLRAANFTQYMPSNAYPIQREFPDIVLKDLAALQGA